MANTIREDVVSIEFEVHDKALADMLQMMKEVGAEAMEMTGATDDGLLDMARAAGEATKGIEELDIVSKTATEELHGVSDSMCDTVEGLKKVGESAHAAEKPTKNLKDTLLSMAGALGLAGVAQAALSGVKDAFGKATARIDTLEQFRRTVSALTGDAGSVDKALESIKKTVTGTAYGLDVAAASVRNFVTGGIELESSTKQFGALADAVAFYGDGTNQTLSVVTEAWAKMATSGRVYADDVRSMTLSGIPVYQIYADAVGQSVEEVQGSFEKGEVSAEQFQKTLTDAMMQGTSSFVSVAGAAQEAGMSWAGAFDNSKAAIVRGAQEIITAIDSTREEMNNPTMREGIAEFGKVAEKALKGVAKAIRPVIQNLDILVGSVAALSAAFAVQKAVKSFTAAISAAKKAIATANVITGAYTLVIGKKAKAQALDTAQILLGTAAAKMDTKTQLGSVGALTLKTTVLGVMTGAIPLATAATMLLKSATDKLTASILANPIMWFVGVSVAVVGVVAAMNSKFYESYMETKRLKEEVKELTANLTELQGQTQESARNFDIEKATIEENVAAVKSYASELSRLVDANGNVTGSAEEVRRIVQEINTLMPGSNLRFDEATNSINMTAGAIENFANVAQEMQISDLADSSIPELQGQLKDYKKNLEDAERLKEELIETGNDKVFFEGVELQTRQMSQAIANAEEAKVGIETVNQLLREREALSREKEEILKNEKIGALSEKWGLEAQQLETAYNFSGMALEEWVGKQDALLAQAQQIYDSNVSGIINSFDEIPTSYEKSASEIIRIMEENAAKTAAFQSNLEMAAGMGMSEAALAYIENAGPAMSGVLQEAINDPAILNGLNSAFESVSAVAGDMTINSGELAASAKEAGFESADEFVISFNTRLGTAGDEMAAAFQMADMDTEGLQADMEIVATAAQTAQTSVSGVGDSLSTASTDFAEMSTSVSTLRTNLQTLGTTAATTGTNMGLALDTLKLKMTETQMAISTELATITTNVKTMATTIKTTLDTLGTTLYTSGVNAMEGFNNGLLSMKETVLATARDIATGVATAVKKAQEINSPSRVMMELGEFTGQGYALGIQSTQPEVSQSAVGMSESALTPRLWPREPETSPVVQGGGGSYVTNNNTPQFTLTIGSNATASDREMERQVKTWIVESFNKLMTGRGRPMQREV